MIFRVCPEVGSDELNALFSSAWPNHEQRDFSYLSKSSLGYICAFKGQLLVGFVNMAWDGSKHAFLLDTTVDKNFQGKGIGKRLVVEAIKFARNKGMEWIHVDFEPVLEGFYQSCGFHSSKAGVYNLMTTGPKVEKTES